MGLGDGDGQGQGPGLPAPAAADGGCGTPEPPLAPRTSEPLTGGRGRISFGRGAAPGLPLGPKHPAPQNSGVTRQGPALSPKVPPPSSPSAAPCEDQSGDSPRSVLTRAQVRAFRCLHPPKERAKGWGRVSLRAVLTPRSAGL